MKKILFFICIFTLVLGFSSHVFAYDGYNNPIRVLLLSSTASQSVTATYSNYTVLDSNGRTVSTLTQGQTINLAPGQRLSSDNGFGRFSFNSKEYRGDLIFNDGVYVNRLGMEEYLLSVVMNEIGGYAPNIEALKTQAVASRSYACVGKKSPRTANYDVFTDTRDQAYGGFSSEQYNSNPSSVSARIKQACASTINRVVYYNGTLAKTIYCANTGGHSENASVVWGGSYPYMIGVESPWDAQSFVAENFGSNGTYQAVKMPTSYRWSKTMSFSEIATKVEAKSNKPLGKLTDIIVKNSGSGYAETVTFVGTSNTVSYSGSDVRTLLNMRSGTFDVVLGYRLSANQNFSLQFLDSANFTQFLNRTGETATFEGRGYGHSVGMSQWGACVMAYKGMNYNYILNYYYNQNQNNGALTIENFKG